MKRDDGTAPRLEIKAVCEAHAAARVRSELLMAHGAVRRLHLAREVQSIYLDTLDGRALDDNLAGISDRTKIRLRWYGGEIDAVTGQLERKRRRNGLGTKGVVPLPVAIALLGVRRQDFMAQLRRACVGPAKAWLTPLLEPAQWIRYRREYFATADGSVRITIDTDLRSLDLRRAPLLDGRRPPRRHALAVFEFKAAPEHRAAIRRLLQQLPLKVDKCSKFVLASDPDQAPRPSRID